MLLDLDDCLYQIEAIPHLMLERIQGMLMCAYPTIQWSHDTLQTT